MIETTIYHNPRCSKSRKVLSILKETNIKYRIVNYIKNPLNHKELTNILNKLNIKPIELIRKNEIIWKELNKKKKRNNNEIIQSMIDYPILIKRPIIIKGDKAVIGRPEENIFKIISL